MHLLNNGSQVTTAPTPKTRVGTAGYFSESNNNNAPSYPGADWFNAVIKEFQGALSSNGVTFNPDNFNHLQLLLNANAEAVFKKYMLFKGMPMSAVGPAPDPDIWLPAGRVELLRADYPTVFEIVSASAFFTDQATIDADPRAFAGHWGTGDGATTFTTDDWALMMNIKVAGGYGAAGTTKEDHLQNITALLDGEVASPHVQFLGDALTASGAFELTGVDTKYGITSETGSPIYGAETISFDASLVARTDTYTDTMGLFLDHFRVIPKGVFSYA